MRTVTIICILVLSIVARASEPGSPERMHEIRMGHQEAKDPELLACDQALIAAHHARESIRAEIDHLRTTGEVPDETLAESFVYGGKPDADSSWALMGARVQTFVEADTKLANHLLICRKKFGDFYSYLRAAPNGRLPRGSVAIAPVRVPPASCADRVMRIVEIKHEMLRQGCADLPSETSSVADPNKEVFRGNCGPLSTTADLEKLLADFQWLGRFCPPRSTAVSDAPIPPPEQPAARAAQGATSTPSPASR